MTQIKYGNRHVNFIKNPDIGALINANGKYVIYENPRPQLNARSVYVLEFDSRPWISTGIISLQFKDTVTKDMIDAIINKYNLHFVKKRDDILLVSSDNNDVVEVAYKLQNECDYIKMAEPEFVNEIQYNNNY